MLEQSLLSLHPRSNANQSLNNAGLVLSLRCFEVPQQPNFLKTKVPGGAAFCPAGAR